MGIRRLNHAVLYVRDVDRSVAFYREVLGFRVKVEIPGRAAFLQAEGSTNDHDLGLFAIGAGAVLFPRLATRVMGTGRESKGIAPLFARMLGARDIALA